MAATAVGAWMNMTMGFGGGWLSFLGCLAVIYFMNSDPSRERPENFWWRLGLLMVFGVFQGSAVGSLVALATYMDPSIVLIASLGTLVVFFCFTMSALLSPRRSFFYLAAILSSGISLLFMTSLLSFFTSFFATPSSYTSPYGLQNTLLNVQLYGGLMIFAGFIVLDTQVVIERAALGSRDAAGHALLLFQDFFSVFVRVLVIMVKNRARRENEDDRRRSKR